MTDRLQIRINYFNIIYDLIDHIQKYLEGLDTPSIKENITGYALVKDVFVPQNLGPFLAVLLLKASLRRTTKCASFVMVLFLR